MSKFAGIYLDVDSTLKEEGKDPSAEMYAVLKQIPLRGLNTQRSIGQARKAVDPQILTLPTITLGGGEIWQPVGESIQTFQLTRVQRVQLAGYFLDVAHEIKLARFYPAGDREVILYAPDPAVAEKFVTLYQSTDSFGQLVTSADEFVWQLEQTPTSMVVMRFNTKKPLVVPRYLARGLNLDLSVPGDLAATRGDVNKGTAVQWVCQSLGIDPKRMVTVGDNPYMDTPAFEVGYGISVGEMPLPHAREHIYGGPAELAQALAKLFNLR
jgi:hydroxymethylpyrimidine pyrophosphatase-like HAD family hydrolase